MMLTKESPVLVILGAWNLQIFNREWIKKNLYSNEDVLIEERPHSLVFGSEDYKIFIDGNRLTFLALQLTPEVLKVIEEKALQIAALLKHTPVSAFGINLLLVSSYTASLTKLKPLEDQQAFIDQDFQPDVLQIHRTFTKENYQLSLIMDFSSVADVKLNVNINYQINSIDLLCKLLQPGLLHQSLLNVQKLLQSQYS